MQDSLTIKKLIIPAILFVIALTFMILYGCKSHDQPSLQRFTASGEILGEEVAKMLGNKGSVLIIAQDKSHSELDAYKSQLDALVSSLKKNEIKISRTEFPPSQEVFSEDGMVIQSSSTIPTDFFLNELKKDSGISAVICLPGPPLLPDNFIKEAGFPKIVALASSESDVERLLESGLIQFAVIPNPDQRKLTVEPKSSREWFNHYYVIRRVRTDPQ